MLARRGFKPWKSHLEGLEGTVHLTSRIAAQRGRGAAQSPRGVRGNSGSKKAASVDFASSLLSTTLCFIGRHLSQGLGRLLSSGAAPPDEYKGERQGPGVSGTATDYSDALYPPPGHRCRRLPLVLAALRGALRRHAPDPPIFPGLAARGPEPALPLPQVALSPFVLSSLPLSSLLEHLSVPSTRPLNHRLLPLHLFAVQHTDAILGHLLYISVAYSMLLK